MMSLRYLTTTRCPMRFRNVLGASVGTALATDADDTVSYTLSDDAGGLFTIDADGVVSVASSRGLITRLLLHSIEVKATSTDGSSSKTFTISVTDDPDEHDLSAISDIDGSPNEVPENGGVGWDHCISH